MLILMPFTHIFILDLVFISHTIIIYQGSKNTSLITKIMLINSIWGMGYLSKKLILSSEYLIHFPLT